MLQQNDTLILEELVGDRLEEEEVGREGEEQEVRALSIFVPIFKFTFPSLQVDGTPGLSKAVQ